MLTKTALAQILLYVGVYGRACPSKASRLHAWRRAGPPTKRRALADATRVLSSIDTLTDEIAEMKARGVTR